MKRVRKTTVWLKSLLVSAVAVVLLEMFEKFKVFQFSCKRSQSSLQLLLSSKTDYQPSVAVTSWDRISATGCIN